MNYLENSWKSYFNENNNKIKSFNSKDYSISDVRKNYLFPVLYKYLRKRAKLTDFLLKSINPTESDLIGQSLRMSGIWPKYNLLNLIPNILTFKNFNEFIFDPNFQKTEKINNLIGGLVVLNVLIQRIQRIIYYSWDEKNFSFLEKELINKPHHGWSPKNHPDWLVLELLMNLTIRKIQVDIAKRMINPPDNINTVMQLNMGEGKTSVIVPMIIIELSNQKYIPRVTVLKQLLQINYNSLVFKLGLILNRRVYMFPFKRDIPNYPSYLSHYSNYLNECKNLYGSVVSVREFRLSFKLKGIEQKLNLKDRVVFKKYLEIDNYIKTYTREILDECDEILYPNYQLIYAVGPQSLMAGGSLRWRVIQTILDLLKVIVTRFNKTELDNYEIEYFVDNQLPWGYPHIRLLNKSSDNFYEKIYHEIASDILKGNTGFEKQFKSIPEHNRTICLKYIFAKELSLELNEFIKNLDDPSLANIIFILRGVFCYNILGNVLYKRWRVDFGVNDFHELNLLQAVPYRAKDVPADKAQFAHQDITLFLTFISYYYSGLSDKQLDKVFQHLNKIESKSAEYSSWISDIDIKFVDKSVSTYNGINLEDSHQKYNILYPLLSKNTRVINFWLSLEVFPTEAKTPEARIETSAWDLSEEGLNPTTGFSGTNDTKNILPLTMNYFDSPDVLHTNGMLISNLLKTENSEYYGLSVGLTAFEILKKISSQPCKVRVLLDVGSLMLEISNEDVIKNWLNLTKESNFEAGLYFDKKDHLMVRDRIGRIHPFELSPYKYKLNKCVIYLDEIHTRGTDLKFPRGTVGIVTLSKQLTKDKILQACMRLRMLGNGHSVIFWGSHEATCSIMKSQKTLKNEILTKDITSKEVLLWAIYNTRNSILDNFIYWALNGISYYKKNVVLENIEINNLKISNILREHILNDLEKMYGISIKEELVYNVVNNIKKIHTNLVDEYSSNLKIIYERETNKILEYLTRYIYDIKKITGCLDEELEMELEVEQEQEREIEYPQEKNPYEPELTQEVVEFIKKGNHNPTSNAILILTDTFKKCSFYNYSQPLAWSEEIFVTRDFTKVVDSYLCDEYLRPPKWIVITKSQKLLILSAFEANELMYEFNKNTTQTSLVMFITRLSPTQRSLYRFSNHNSDFNINFNDFVQLSVFAGSLYFHNNLQEIEFNKFIGYFPFPRDEKEEELFNKRIINLSTFIETKHRIEAEKILRRPIFTKFVKNPNTLLMKIFQIRNLGNLPKMSHVNMILEYGRSPFHKIKENIV